MHKKILLLAAAAALCGSGCTATLHPGGTVHAHYWAPNVVLETAPAPVVVAAPPHPAPAPRRVFLPPLMMVSYPRHRTDPGRGAPAPAGRMSPLRHGFR